MHKLKRNMYFAKCNIKRYIWNTLGLFNYTFTEMLDSKGLKYLLYVQEKATTLIFFSRKGKYYLLYMYLKYRFRRMLWQ